MTDTERKALQAKEKAEVTSQAEQTRPGVVFTPAVDIFETDKEITLLADMPGVTSKALSIDLHENILTLDGDVNSPERDDEVDIMREYRTGKYYRQFTLSQVIDQSKIDAVLKDGVLRLRLPKVEAPTPRKIAVKTK
ncbi:MAG: Hsp20/alpha crystallin family protein [Deltaproteobacteria bacterium]|nr:Hsp20/alpha crystallin family protein [Deltaproteobacteria bacterium]